jgi:hypothetical protein
MEGKAAPLFVEVNTQQTVNIVGLPADYFIDTSGSTAGSILRYEVESVKMLAEYLKPQQYVSWNSTATKVTNLSTLRSEGGTNPVTFAPYTEQSQCVVVYTDGQIGANDMAQFKTVMANKMANVPVVIVFAVTGLDATITRMEASINMSIPETFLSLSNDVIILVTSNGFHRTLMAKGCFNEFPTVTLSADLNLSDLPVFEFASLKNLTTIAGLPSHVIKLKGIAHFIDLNVLYTVEDLPTAILEGLCDRTLLPKFNLTALHALLNRMNRKITENPELERIRDQLWQMAMSSEAGTEKHQEMIRLYHTTRSARFNNENYNEVKAKNVAINRLLEMISEYQRNATAIVFGSNRANRSTQFDAALLAVMEGCIQVECPILLTEGSGCLLIKDPTANKPNYIEEFTSDYAMEAPFEFGTWLVDYITPGIFGQEMAEAMVVNPYTREPVIGFLPISSSPAVIMRHMSKLFGGQKELWHFVRGYIAMMVKALMTLPWLNDHKALIIQSLTDLLKAYNADAELRSGNNKVPLQNALRNVLLNYSVCLRDRTYEDVIAIMNIAKVLDPEYEFDEKRITGMITVVKEFNNLLTLYKKETTEIRDSVMTVDDYNHYVSYTPGVKGLIAQILWYDYRGEYKLLKLHLAIEKALNDKRFGAALKQAMNGNPFDEATLLECKLPEPTGSHFAVPEPFFQWDSAGLGFPEFQCVYCGQCYPTAKEKLAHLKEALGEHFYNGQNICKNVVHECMAAGITDEKELFKKVKERLYRGYGDKNKAFHTARNKMRMLYFIRLFLGKQAAPLMTEKKLLVESKEG